VDRLLPEHPHAAARRACGEPDAGAAACRLPVVKGAALHPGAAGLPRRLPQAPYEAATAAPCDKPPLPGGWHSAGPRSRAALPTARAGAGTGIFDAGLNMMWYPGSNITITVSPANASTTDRFSAPARRLLRGPYQGLEHVQPAHSAARACAQPDARPARADVQHYPNSAGGVLQIRNPTEDAIINNNCNAATQPCCMTRPNMAQYFLSWPDPPISCYVPDYTAPSTFTLAVRARVGRPQRQSAAPW